MRSSIYKLVICIPTIVLISCKPAPDQLDELYGSGFVIVREVLWSANNETPYPFTVDYGEISCGQPHAGIGRQVYFSPENLTHESYIGTPLNKAAVDSLKQGGDTPNVPYAIKKDADLSDAIKIGLRICDEQRDSWDRGL